MNGRPAHTSSKEKMAPELMFLSEHVPQLSIIENGQYDSLTGMFSLLNSATNEEQQEKHLCNLSSHHEKYG